MPLLARSVCRLVSNRVGLLGKLCEDPTLAMLGRRRELSLVEGIRRVERLISFGLGCSSRKDGRRAVKRKGFRKAGIGESRRPAKVTCKGTGEAIDAIDGEVVQSRKEEATFSTNSVSGRTVEMRVGAI